MIVRDSSNGLQPMLARYSPSSKTLFNRTVKTSHMSSLIPEIHLIDSGAVQVIDLDAKLDLLFIQQ
jgi:hypothetical protein